MSGSLARSGKRIGRKFLQNVLGVFLGTLGLGTSIVEMLREKESDQIRKILVIRLDLLGDVVLSMPAVRALKETFPAARLDMLVLPYTRPLVEMYPQVTRVFDFDVNKLRPSGNMTNPAQWKQFKGLIRNLRSEKYDLCVSLHGHPASAIALLCGARLRIGYGGDSYPFAQNISLPGKRYRIRKHEAEYSLDVVKAVGAQVKDKRLFLTPRGEDIVRMKDLLDGEKNKHKGPLIGIHAGAANGAAKRWILSKWSVLADRLVDEMDAVVVFTGSSGELSLVGEVVTGMKNTPIVMTGKTTIPELAALISRCDIMVSGDSGPMHIAVALGVPTVAIHGPTDPLLSGPFGGNITILRKPVSCSPCYDLSDTADCPTGSAECMEAISEAEVFDAITNMLNQTGGAPDNGGFTGVHYN